MTQPSSPIPLGALRHPILAREITGGASLELGKRDPLVVFSGPSLPPVSRMCPSLPCLCLVWSVPLRAFSGGLSSSPWRSVSRRARSRRWGSCLAFSPPLPPALPRCLRPRGLPSVVGCGSSLSSPRGRVSLPGRVVLFSRALSTRDAQGRARTPWLKGRPGTRASLMAPQICRTASARQGRTIRDLHHVGQFSRENHREGLQGWRAT